MHFMGVEGIKIKLAYFFCTWFVLSLYSIDKNIWKQQDKVK